MGGNGAMKGLIGASVRTVEERARRVDGHGTISLLLRVGTLPLIDAPRLQTKPIAMLS